LPTLEAELAAVFDVDVALESPRRGAHMGDLGVADAETTVPSSASPNPVCRPRRRRRFR